MQDSNKIGRRQHISGKFAETWKRLRRLRRGVHRPSGRTEKYTVEIFPSPFQSQYISPFKSDPNGLPPFLASLPTIEKLRREATGRTAIFLSPTMDGALEKSFGSSRSSPVAAIFVHAGAGYHSTTNEHIHLAACKDAARMAMSILKNGESAVAAVEAAIRVLEDKEITNAGYGSNLTIEGVVECDATIVDHLGRSGACGATAKIKNPIHLARAILEASSRPLSLRRVPPNLLVGEGATAFAWDHNVNVVPHDALVSRSARERFLRWRDDLKRAGRAHLTPETPSSPNSTCEEEIIDLEYEERVRNKQRRDHANAMLSGTWNEGQPDSPQSQSPAPINSSAESLPYLANSPRSTDVSPGTPPSAGKIPLSTPWPLQPVSRHPSAHSSPEGASPTKRSRYGALRNSDRHSRTHSLLSPSGEGSESIPEVDMTPRDIAIISKTHQSEGTDGPTSPTDADFLPLAKAVLPPSREKKPRAIRIEPDEDFITDTVGAIAIDIFGNIAAGSSSGGIGMKHRGRVGPAALVGIGTAVIPADPKDPDGITVAAVTSGTGEHMATTMASQKCAERLYFGTRRAAGGLNAPAAEEESMHSFIQDDFMDHPGVKNGHSGGAIGVMAVKKTPYGYFLHFAHNTDSFALASMHSNEKEAKCVMSRIGDQANVVQGGRKIRVKVRPES